MRKILYVSDLDGTLLQSDQTVSKKSADIINELINKGICFSYATARSLLTSKKVTENLKGNIPVIVYNGTFVVDKKNGKILIGHFFGKEIIDFIQELCSYQIYPIVYAYIDGVEHFSYLKGKATEGMKEFFKTRPNDPRTRVVESLSELIEGEIFYVNCIDESEKLFPFYAKYKHVYHCVYDEDLYSKNQWFEIMPKGVSKANAIRELKAQLNCDYVIAFGDGRNDIEMFMEADECYAVSNACEELKKIATGIIPSNNEDAVAKMILKKEAIYK